MSVVHKELAAGRWFNFSLLEQMANVGSEVERTISWGKKGNMESRERAFWRSHELLSLTISDKKNITRLRELCRVREVLVDHFLCDNTYNTTPEYWQKYFYQFAYAAQIQRGKIKI